jgi:hypothetical protein
MYVQIPPASSLFFSNIARRGSSDVFSKVLLHRSSFSLPFFWSFFWSFFWCQATFFFLLVPGFSSGARLLLGSLSSGARLLLGSLSFFSGARLLFYFWCQATFTSGARLLLLVPGYFYFWCQATSGIATSGISLKGYFLFS